MNAIISFVGCESRRAVKDVCERRRVGLDYQYMKTSVFMFRFLKMSFVMYYSSTSIDVSINFEYQ